MSASSERILELAADKVLWGLTSAEAREFAVAGREAALEFDAMERVGAAVTASFAQGSIEAVPTAVLERLRRSGSEFLAAQAAVPSPEIATALGEGGDVQRSASIRAAAPASISVLWSGWIAAAAAILVAVLLWFERATTTEIPAPDERLQVFLAEHPDAQRRAWEVGPNGDVVWSPTAQSGFLVLDALPASDESFQYQLWIFDSGRSTDHPVDGGVFDIRAAGTVVVPIDAKIAVDDAFGFAITKERRGGVVVSDRTQVVAAVGL